MKKTLLTLAFIAALSAACSDDDQDTCHCDAVFATGLQEDPTYVGTYDNMEINCSTGEPDINPTANPNAYFHHCEE
jgi:nucleoside-specific outer membrane channel protein Tsx